MAKADHIYVHPLGYTHHGIDMGGPLLRIGEVLHVGKGTAFGLGKYRLEA